MEAEQSIELGFLVHSFYPALKLEFDVSVVENSSLLVGIFDYFIYF